MTVKQFYDLTVTLLVATDLKFEYGSRLLFEGVSLNLKLRDRIALVGPNGVGKTTLLRLLAGELNPDRGEVSFGKGVTWALHDQRPPAHSAQSLEEYVLSGSQNLIEVEKTLQRLEKQMESDHSTHLLRHYASKQQELEVAGGYGWREKPLAYLRSLGFSQSDMDRPLASFSGGELTRASLARALGSKPDVLFLDEPTNHLDLNRIEWLEKEVIKLDAAVVMVAHDRWFLEATTTSVLELDSGRSTYFAGPWHAWRKEKVVRASFGDKTEIKRKAELDQLENFVARFRYGTRARQAQAKLKKIDRIKEIESTFPARRFMEISSFMFPIPERCARTVVEGEDLNLAVADRQLLLSGDIAIERGEKVALVGLNGSGKTTLVEVLIGLRQPKGGVVRMGYGVKVAYFSQNDVECDDHLSVADTLSALAKIKGGDARKLLGHFGFSGIEQEKLVGMLSGGERRRLLLASVVAQGANFLVLDEPTNHLDLDGREALEQAMGAFPGAVLLVSHDRALLDSVADRVVEIDESTLKSFPGGWADFLERREEEIVKTEPHTVVRKKRQRRKLGVSTSSSLSSSDLQRIEEKVSELEANLAQLEKKLASCWDDPVLQKNYAETSRHLKVALEKWEELSARLDQSNL